MNTLFSSLINEIIIFIRDINVKLLKKTRKISRLIVKEIMFL